MRAFSLIRQAPEYRHKAFLAGLAAAGYEVREARPTVRQSCDVLLMWNRYWENDTLGDQIEAQGGRVLVAENGYLGMDWKDRRRYALALHGHNGSGQWPSSGLRLPQDAELGGRFAELGYSLDPWRPDDGGRGHILVCPNRAFGMKDLAMSSGWEADVVRRLRTVTKRPIRVRPHPGRQLPDAVPVPLERDLEGAWAVVIWASSAGVHALRYGIPVICESPWWICKAAAGELHQVENPPMDDVQRLLAFQRLAWAQWHVDEIAAGIPFRLLLQ